MDILCLKVNYLPGAPTMGQPGVFCVSMTNKERNPHHSSIERG